MSQLPPGLEAWAGVLSGIRPELVGTLADWLPRLSGLVGPLQSRQSHARRGEPDGFDGLSRRGNWEHLLLSEWALADEVPEEFLRRAAMQEQLFLKPARVEPKGARRVVVLFDAGPDQMGSLRLAHLALLLLMIRRTSDAGATLAWGHLQSPNQGLSASYGPDNGKSLFRQRTPSAPTDAHRDAWLAQLDEPHDELWVVGGPDAHLTGARTISVQDPYEPNVDELAISLSRPGHRRPLQLRLTLPDAHSCARILRVPFPTVPSSTPPTGGAQLVRPQVRFNATGSKLFTHIRRELCSWSVPLRGHRVKQHMRMDSTPNLLAVGYRKRRLFAVYTDGETLTASALTQGIDGWCPDATPVQLPIDFVRPDASRSVGLAYCMSPVQEENERTLMIQDAVGAVWLLHFHDGTHTLLEANAAPLSWHQGTFTLLVRREGKRQLLRFSHRATPQHTHLPVIRLQDGPLENHFGLSQHSRGAIVIPMGGGLWQTIGNFATGRHGANTYKIPEEEEVFGCGRTPDPNGVFTLSADRLSVRLHGDEGVHTLFNAECPILSARLSPGRQAAALWLADGRVVVFSPVDGSYMHDWPAGSP